MSWEIWLKVACSYSCSAQAHQQMGPALKPAIIACLALQCHTGWARKPPTLPQPLCHCSPTASIHILHLDEQGFHFTESQTWQEDAAWGGRLGGVTSRRERSQRCSVGEHTLHLGRWSAVLFSRWKKLHCSCAAVSKRAHNVNKGHFAPRTLPVRTAAIGEVLQHLSRRGQTVECGNNNNTQPAETQSKVQPMVRVKWVTAYVWEGHDHEGAHQRDSTY